MHVFAGRPPGTLWVPAFVVVAEGFSPAAVGWRNTLAARLKPSASITKPFGLRLVAQNSASHPSLIFPLDPSSQRAILQVHRKIETNVQVAYMLNDALPWQAGGWVL